KHSGYQTIGVAPDSASLDGTLTETPQTITLLYSAIGQETTPQKSGPLTINYVDENGNPLAPSVTKTASVGNGYLVTHQDIPGYTYVSLATGSATPTGTFTADNQVITYVYQKTSSVHQTMAKAQPTPRQRARQRMTKHHQPLVTRL
uniref:MucBP domain-containing protein n=1 Tax=Secundilactobacillus paracollinoides TaxID=240427 RepID=UPI000A3E9F26